MFPYFLLYLLFITKNAVVSSVLTNSTFVCVNSEAIALRECEGKPNCPRTAWAIVNTRTLALYCYDRNIDDKIFGPTCQSTTNKTSQEQLDTVVSRPASTSLIKCPAITEAHGALKECEVKFGPGKGSVPCDKPVPIGTRVSLECPAFYERAAGSSSIICLQDGTWSQKPLSCRPVCGLRRTSGAVKLIVDGWEVALDESPPWQSTLFSQKTGNWSIICAGTLIAERLVLTAAHCVWRTSPKTIRVAFAITSSNLSRLNDASQVIDVERIEIPEAYQDYESNYGSDIGVLVLKKPVIINRFVAPACIEWDSYKTLMEAQENGHIGLTAGFGYTENDRPSETLRMATVKIVTDRDCRANEKSDFKKYLTYTSFCAGWVNGTGVCNGDSGGGLVLERGNSSIWYVYGIVSISPRKLGTSFCDPMYYTVFTKVFIYREWIAGILAKFPTIGPSDIDDRSNTEVMT